MSTNTTSYSFFAKSNITGIYLPDTFAPILGSFGHANTSIFLLYVVTYFFSSVNLLLAILSIIVYISFLFFTLRLAAIPPEYKSKSIINTLLFNSQYIPAKLSVMVVFPTPPLTDEIVIIFPAILTLSFLFLFDYLLFFLYNDL